MKKNHSRFIIFGAAALLIAGFGYYLWQKSNTYESTENAQLDSDILPVRAEITGKISRIYFSDNQQVKIGDTLLAFCTNELQAKIQQAEAALENAKAVVKVSGTRAIASNENATASAQNTTAFQQGILSAKANLSKAQKNFIRAGELLQAKAVTQEQYETAQTGLSLAETDYDKAVSQQRSAMTSSSGLKTQARADLNQIPASRALVKQREAELLEVREQLEHAWIIAPFGGIVTRRTVQTGQYVSAGAPLCTVINQSGIWVTANFKETQLKNIKPGQEVDIKIDAYPDLTLTGKVESLGGATGAKFSLIPPDNASGNFIKITQRFPIRIALFSLPQNKPTVLFAGLSAYVKVKIN